MEREEALVLFENLTGAAPHVAEHVLDAHGWVGAGWLVTLGCFRRRSEWLCCCRPPLALRLPGGCCPPLPCTHPNLLPVFIIAGGT